MSLSNPARYIAVCLLFAIAAAGCGFWRGGAGSETASAARRSTPFPTKEPDIYRAQIVISTGGIERRIFTARKGAASRIDYDYGTPRQKTVIRADSEYVISERLQIYAETASAIAEKPESELANDVTSSLLSRKSYTTYENLGRENGLTKYRASSDENKLGETIIFVDEANAFPVRHEFYGIGADNRKVLQYTVEVRDLALEADESLFAIPAGFRRVQLAEFKRLVR